jgi:hypothetical protein
MPAEAERRLDMMTFLTSHNAFNSAAAIEPPETEVPPPGTEPPPTAGVPNQTKLMTDQLNDGVRALMLDTHYDTTPAGKTVFMCHTPSGPDCGTVDPSALSAKVPFQDGLTEIVAWMNGPGKNEVVTVMLEDYTEAADLKAVFDAVPGANQLLFDANAWQVESKGWPLISEMVTAGNRLLVLISPATGGDEREAWGLMSAPKWTVENTYDLGAGEECTSRWDDIPLDKTEAGFNRLFVMNHFRSIPHSPKAGEDNGTILSRAQNTCMVAAKRKPNFLAVDFYELPEGTGVLPAVTTLNEYYKFPDSAPPPDAPTPEIQRVTFDVQNEGAFLLDFTVYNPGLPDCQEKGILNPDEGTPLVCDIKDLADITVRAQAQAGQAVDYHLPAPVDATAPTVCFSVDGTTGDVVIKHFAFDTETAQCTDQLLGKAD